MTTVASLCARIAYDLQEDPSSFPVSSSYWTTDEVISYINYAEADFSRRTGISKGVASLVVNTMLVDLPDDAVNVERASFNGRRLRRASSWDLERQDANWRSRTGRPKLYKEDRLTPGYMELDVTPSSEGVCSVIYDSMPQAHTALTDSLSIPDPWLPYIAWEVISLALAKDGDHQDVERSQYAHQRYLFGVAIARRAIIGSEAIPYPVSDNA